MYINVFDKQNKYKSNVLTLFSQKNKKFFFFIFFFLFRNGKQRE